jgi:hypothetical protein
VTDNLAAAADVSQFLGLPEPADLARLQAICTSVSAMIRRHTGQTLTVVTGDVEVVPATEWPAFNLSQRPVSAITALTVAGTAFTGYTFTTNGIVTATAGGNWSLGATVTYTHGFAEGTDGYELLRQVCITAAARIYTLNQDDEARAMGTPGIMESVGYAPEAFLTQSERMTLADFGKLGVG